MLSENLTAISAVLDDYAFEVMSEFLDENTEDATDFSRYATVFEQGLRRVGRAYSSTRESVCVCLKSTVKIALYFESGEDGRDYAYEESEEIMTALIMSDKLNVSSIEAGKVTYNRVLDRFVREISLVLDYKKEAE